MPDLKFQVEAWNPSHSRSGRCCDSSCGSAKGLPPERTRWRFKLSRCSVSFASSRVSGVTRPLSRRSCSISSTARRGGGRRSARCSGRMRASASGPFTESILVDLPVPCTYDFNVAITKYFYALEEGEIPVTLLFSGTMFYDGEDGALQVAQIPWDKEAAFRLPVSVWKEMMEQYYPNSAWLCLRKDVFDRLYQYKSREGIPTWEQALETPLAGTGKRELRLRPGETGRRPSHEAGAGGPDCRCGPVRGVHPVPLRPSIKNRQRWTFGGLYPRNYCEAQGSGDSWSMQTECLLRGTTDTVIQITVRFLHLQARKVGQLDYPVAMEPGEEPVFQVVEQVKVGDRLLQSWQEAVQREVVLDGLAVATLRSEPVCREFVCPASRRVEAVRGETGLIEAVLVREQHEVAGRVQVSALLVGEGLFKLRVRIENDSAFSNARQTGREDAVLHSLASTHTILCVQNGEFCSAIDPPRDCAARGGCVPQRGDVACARGHGRRDGYDAVFANHAL